MPVQVCVVSWSYVPNLGALNYAKIGVQNDNGTWQSFATVSDLVKKQNPQSQIPNALSTIGTIACAGGVGVPLHVLFTTTENNSTQVWHTSRSTAGTWGSFKQIFPSTSAIAAASPGDGTLRVIYIQGGIPYYTVLNTNGTWESPVNLIQTVTNQNPGSLNPQQCNKVACAFVNGNLHVLLTPSSLSSATKLYHTIQLSASNWQAFGDVYGEVATNSPGVLSYISCAAIGADLHVCVVRDPSYSQAAPLSHTIRFSTGSWQNFWGDVFGAVKSQNPNSPTPSGLKITGVACAGTGGNLNVGVTTNMYNAKLPYSGPALYSTTRLSTGNWQAFVPAGEDSDVGSYATGVSFASM